MAVPGILVNVNLKGKLKNRSVSISGETHPFRLPPEKIIPHTGIAKPATGAAKQAPPPGRYSTSLAYELGT